MVPKTHRLPAGPWETLRTSFKSSMTLDAGLPQDAMPYVPTCCHFALPATLAERAVEAPIAGLTEHGPSQEPLQVCSEGRHRAALRHCDLAHCDADRAWTAGPAVVRAQLPMQLVCAFSSCPACSCPTCSCPFSAASWPHNFQSPISLILFVTRLHHTGAASSWAGRPPGKLVERACPRATLKTWQAAAGSPRHLASWSAPRSCDYAI